MLNADDKTVDYVVCRRVHAGPVECEPGMLVAHDQNLKHKCVRYTTSKPLHLVLRAAVHVSSHALYCLLIGSAQSRASNTAFSLVN